LARVFFCRQCLSRAVYPAVVIHARVILPRKARENGAAAMNPAALLARGLNSGGLDSARKFVDTKKSTKLFYYILLPHRLRRGVKGTISYTP